MTKARDMADIVGGGFAIPTSSLTNVTGKNLIINGAMQVAQRGTSISRSASNIDYTFDRFLSRSNSSCTHTVTQETDVPDGFQNSLKVVRDSGQTGSTIRLEQPIETNVMTQCRGKKVTLSFYAKKDSGASVSTLSVNLFTGDGTEGQRAITAYANEVRAIDAETATLTNSWQRFTFTSSSTLITDLTQMAVQLVYSPTGTAPSNDGYFITGIQLEVGDVATPFEHESYAATLQKCQRYYLQICNGSGDVISTGSFLAGGANQIRGAVQFPVEMRAGPTVISNSGSGYFDLEGVTNFTGPMLIAYNNTRSCLLYYTNPSALTNGLAGLLRSSNASASLALQAEL